MNMACKMFKRNLFMFLDLQVSIDQNNNEGLGKIDRQQVAQKN